MYNWPYTPQYTERQLEIARVLRDMKREARSGRRPLLARLRPAGR